MARLQFSSRYKVSRLLSRGAFSKVVQATRIVDQLKVAVKVMRSTQTTCPYFTTKSTPFANFKRGCTSFACDALVDRDRTYIVLEFYPISLRSRMERSPRLHIDESRGYISNMIHGLRFMQRHAALHTGA